MRTRDLKAFLCDQCDDVIAGISGSMFDKQEQWPPWLPANAANLGLGMADDVSGVLRTVATWTTVALSLAPRLHSIPSLRAPRNIPSLSLSHSALL